MLEINGTEYNLCLLDTNALSNLLKSPKDWIENIDSHFDISKTIICYSIFTLSELSYNIELFNKYLDFFSIFPSAVLDGHESIFVKETENYSSLKPLSPVVLTPFAINDSSMSQKERLQYVLENSSFIGRTEYWKESQKQILDGILSLKSNFPPEKKAYSKKEIEFFCFSASTTQVGLRNNKFAKKTIQQGSALDFEKLPSIKCTSYVVFYKFYPDNRNPEPSDIFDIFISSLLPYVDFFITERNLNHIVKQIQQNHNFLTNVQSFTMKQINKTKL